MSEIKNIALEASLRAIELRKIIHANPELALKEEKTACLIEEELKRLGISCQRVAGTGIVGLLQGAAYGRTIALRADIDALDIPEETGCNFASKINGVMHACGHDVHTAVLLGVANALVKFKKDLKGNIKFFFQPAEENGPTGGAKLLIKEGALLNPKVDMVLGLHVHPDIPSGKIGIKEGVTTSNSDRFTIKISGKECHGSTPHEGVDALVIASHLVTAIQTIISRNIDPRMIGALTLGIIRGGRRYDTVADEVMIQGTCRTFDDESRELIPRRLKTLSDGIASTFGASAEVEYFLGYPSVINDKQSAGLVVDAARESLGESNVIIMDYPVMFAEDFSYYLKDTPGAFFMIGATSPGSKKIPLHNSKFLPPEDCLSVGVEVLSRASILYLNK